jgi:hypothetical protein
MRIERAALALDDPSASGGFRVVELSIRNINWSGAWSVEGEACPTCKRPLVLARRERHEQHKSKDGSRIVFVAPAHCESCADKVGQVEALMCESSLFGSEEDARVFGGPWKVF